MRIAPPPRPAAGSTTLMERQPSPTASSPTAPRAETARVQSPTAATISRTTPLVASPAPASTAIRLAMESVIAIWRSTPAGWRTTAGRPTPSSLKRAVMRSTRFRLPIARGPTSAVNRVQIRKAPPLLATSARSSTKARSSTQPWFPRLPLTPPPRPQLLLQRQLQLRHLRPPRRRRRPRRQPPQPPPQRLRLLPPPLRLLQQPQLRQQPRQRRRQPPQPPPPRLRRLTPPLRPRRLPQPQPRPRLRPRPPHLLLQCQKFFLIALPKCNLPLWASYITRRIGRPPVLLRSGTLK